MHALPARRSRLSDFLVPSSALALTLLSGCWGRHLPGVDLDASLPSSGTGGSYGGDASYGTGGSPRVDASHGTGGAPGADASCGAGGATTDARKLDILFMIDNSSSMAPLQAKLRAQVPAFIDTLADPATGTLPDLHVAVVSSSFGAGAWANVNGCHSAAADPNTTGDDQGRFRQGRGSCTMLHPGATFLETGGGAGGGANFDGDLRNAVGCITDLGDNGCGFESQFASIYYALYKGSLSPTEDPDNGGFLRPNAKLAIVLLTNEDDCSVRGDSLLLDPAVNSVNDPTGLGALASYRCNEFGHLCNGAPPPHGNLPAGGVTLNNCVSAENMGKTDDLLTDPNGNPDPTRGHLWPTVVEFGDYVRMFKANPSDVFVAAIAGPTTGPMGESLYHVSPRVNAAAGNELDPTIDHSCVGDATQPEFADPAVRIKQWVDGFGANGAFYPICGPNLSTAMIGIAQGIHSKLTP
jgi:hypothetical protein